MNGTVGHPVTARTLIGMVLVALVFHGAARAVPIDDFSTPQGPATDFVNDNTFASSTLPGAISGTIVPSGGQRQLRVSKTDDSLGFVEAEILPGGQIYDSVGTVSGQFSLDYQGLGGVDLSGFGQVLIAGSIDSSAAAGGGTSLGVRLEDSSLNSTTVAALLATEGPFEIVLPIADFQGVNLFEIDSISIGSYDNTGAFVNVPAGGDVTLRSVELVPEPASLATWLVLGGGSLLFWVVRTKHCFAVR